MGPEEFGPTGASMADLIDLDIHMIVECYGCRRKLRLTPTEAADLLGSDCTMVMARDRFVCSWCRKRGQRWIAVYPDSLDMSAQTHLGRAERELRVAWHKDAHLQQTYAEAVETWEKRRPKDKVDDMCNAYRLGTPITKLIRDMEGLGLPLRFEGGATPNLAQWEMTRPTNELPVFRPIDAYDPGAGMTLVHKRWWLVPFFHRGPVKDWKAMCTNARAETVATSRTFKGPFERRSCLVPADAYYEWTGEKGAKTRWRFQRTDGDWFAMAGIWDKAETADGWVESYSIITTKAGPDSAPYHDRQPVILVKRAMTSWLDLSADAAQLLVPSPAGMLEVQQA